LTDAEDQGAAYLADYRSTLTGLMVSYYTALQDWVNDIFDIQFAAQFGYNLPVDMLQGIPSINAPETESLSFGDNIDAFRQYTGPANLAGKRVISMELGTEFYVAYRQTWDDLLWDAKVAFVAGVNQAVIHGAPYSYDFPNTTWPGFTTFGYLFSGQHSRHQPAWDAGYLESGNYLARIQYILQQGIPKVDVVFWNKQDAQQPVPQTLYAPFDLIDAGFTYEYLSPENFVLETAYVQDGSFAPTRQAFKALIIRGNDTMTISGAEYLFKYANEGLPIIVSGGLPTTYDTASNGTAAAITSLQRILSLPNVQQIGNEGVGEVVKSLGITPRTKVNTTGTWYTRWRETTDGDTYVYIFNNGEDSEGTISFNNTFSPTILNAWTGSEKPVLQYSIKGSYTTIPFTLKHRETTIIHFSPSNSPLTHITSTEGSVIVVGSIQNETSSEMGAKVAYASSPGSITLSTGAQIILNESTSISPSYALQNWTLVVESWTSPSDVYDLTPQATKTNITVSLPSSTSTLSSWTTFSELADVSGVGYYTTAFLFSPASSSGAILQLPPISHGVVGYLNGRALPAFDITNPMLDLADYLQDGTNELLLKVSSTLFNALRPIYAAIETEGGGPSLNLEVLETLGYGDAQDYGIIGDVSIIPYRTVNLG
jgi:hypothetical protein